MNIRRNVSLYMKLKVDSDNDQRLCALKVRYFNFSNLFPGAVNNPFLCVQTKLVFIVSTKWRILARQYKAVLK